MNEKKLLVASVFILFGILFRTVWHLGENVEFVTTATLLSGAYLGITWAIGVPLVIMVITDAIIGNTNIFLFTWSGYMTIGLMGYIGLSQKPKAKSQSDSWRTKIKIKKILKATGSGIGASIFFYLWTNFGVWLLDSWGMYPKTLSGLIDAYIFGLPFLKSNMVGNLFLIPATFSLIEFGKRFTGEFMLKRNLCKLLKIAR